MEQIQGGVCAAKGFTASGIHCGIRKNKTKLERKLRAGAFQQFEDDFDLDEPAFEVRTKTFPIKPMALEEAILQMNLLGHQFFVFRDAPSSNVCVVYRRKDGAYGLIVPQ